jgi:hypothetical protein
MKQKNLKKDKAFNKINKLFLKEISIESSRVLITFIMDENSKMG